MSSTQKSYMGLDGKKLSLLYASNKGADQLLHMCRLFRAFINQYHKIIDGKLAPFLVVYVDEQSY